MNATKILWGQVLLVSAVTLAFVWGATEWVAWRLAFQTQLGHPLFEFLGWSIISATRVLLVVVRLRRLRARHFRRGRVHRRLRRDRRRRRGDRNVGLAGSGG